MLVSNEKQTTKRKRESSPAKVRMTEVAKLAGVSTATVSRALQGSPLVSPGSRAKILAIADRLGYSRSPIASSLSGTPTPLIGVIVPALITPFYAETLQTLSSELETAGYQLMIGHHDHNLAREEQIVAAFASWNPSALIVTGVDHTRAATAILSGINCPVIEMWDLDDRPLDSLIGFSNYDAGKAVAAHLLASGRRRLLYVLSPTEHDTRAKSRYLGFKDEVERHPDANVTAITATDRTFDAGREALQRIIESHPNTDAIAFYSDPLAVGALNEAERRGIAIPDSLAIVGFGDLDFSAFSTPALTTIRPPRQEIGKAVAQHILLRLKDPQSGGVTVDLGFKLIVRQSG